MKPGLYLLLSVGVVMNGEIAPGMSRTGSVMMAPASRTRLLGWIGFVCAFTGAVISIFSLPDDTLPINQALLELDCILITTWFAVLLVRGGAGQR